MKSIQYPVRINHYLALQNLCSRREADRLIADGKVRINGRTALLGEKVNEGDVVEVEESVARKKAEREFYAYHKPAGVSTDPELKGDNIVQKNIRLKKKVYSLDRLDTDMHGILLLSTDERIRDLLLNPRFAAEQEYIVKVHRPIDKKFIDRLRAGVMINKTLVRPISCEQVAEQTFRITLLHEPYHNVRSICLALHYEPIDILRVRIKNVELRHLKEGEWRLLEGKERADFLQSIGE